MKHKIKTLS